MDFLPWSSNSDQESLKPEVPCLVDGPILGSPASEPLDGVKSIDIGRGLPVATLEQLAKDCQGWGYFRLLRSIFGPFFSPTDFVNADDIVHSRDLGASLFRLFSDRPILQKGTPSLTLTTYGVGVANALELVSKTFEEKAVPKIAEMERDVHGGDELLEAYIVLFSVVLLHEYICEAYLSHVWAGGLGNFSANSLPKCRLEEIHDMIDNDTNLPVPGFKPGPLYRVLSAVKKAVWTSISKALKPTGKFTGPKKLYWLDTLCIPVDPDNLSPCRCPACGPPQPSDECLACDATQPSDENSTRPRRINYTQKAINSMARIYTGAANVLVLDPELQRLQLEEHNPGPMQTGLDDCVVAVAACSWMARSWTYHEGALAVDTYFKFGNGIKSYSQIQEVIERSDLVDDFLIEPLWQRDIMNAQETTVSRSVLTNLVWKVTSGTMPVTPSEKFANTKERDLVHFVDVWNELATRGTMEPRDIAAIMASMLNRSAAEVLHLPIKDRMKALLRSQSLLPASLLCAPRATDMCARCASDWVPEFPTSQTQTVPLVLSKELWMEWHENGNLVLDTPPELYLHVTSIDLESLPGDVIPDVEGVQNKILMLKVLGARRKITFRTMSSDKSGLLDGPVIFWFDTTFDSSGSLLGHAFVSVRSSPTGAFYAQVGRSFRWNYIDNAQVEQEQEEQEGDQDSHDLNVFACPSARKVSNCKKLVVVVDGMNWPMLSWSRMQAFPFVKLGLGLQQASDVGFTATYLLWMFAWAIYPMCYVAIFFYPELRERFISPTTSPFFTPKIVQLPLLFPMIRFVVAVFERIFLKRLESKWVQRAWAASFWDSREAYTGSFGDDHVDTWTESAALQEQLLGRMYPTFAIKIIVVLIGAAVFLFLALLGLLRYFDPVPPQYLWSSVFFAVGSAFFDKFWLAVAAISCCVLIAEAFLRAAIHFFYLRNWRFLVEELKSDRSQGSVSTHGEAIGGRVLREYSQLLRVALLVYACVLALLSSFLIGSRYTRWGYAGIGLAGFWVLVTIVLGLHSVLVWFNFRRLWGRLRPGGLGRGPISLEDV